MKVLIGGIVFTATMGLVGCGAKNKDDEAATPVKVEHKTEAKKAEEPKSAKKVEVEHADEDLQYQRLQSVLKDLEAKIEIIAASLKNKSPDQPAVNTDAILAQMEKKVAELIKPLHDLSAGDQAAVKEMKAVLASLLRSMDGLGKDRTEGATKLNNILKRLNEFEKTLNVKQTAFHRACMASLNVADADADAKRNVLNAIAFVNTSKVARATETTQKDFDTGSRLSYGNDMNGIVFSGTHSEHRKVDNSYTYYAYSRLPSATNYNQLRYHSFQFEDGKGITALNADVLEKFIFADQDNSYRTETFFRILDEQSATKAIDANKIESYSQIDCDHIATYMANVGSKSLTTSIDNPTYVASLNTNGQSAYARDIRTKLNNESVVSDILAMLDFRGQIANSSVSAHDGYSDSPRVMVLQDDLLRRRVNGTIDYSFLDLVDAPHLRFLAALDSQIGQAKKENGVDFDNAYEGKNDSLISFVKRHRTDTDHVRRDKGFKDLEAVFVKFIPDVIQKAPEVEKKKSHNLFHTP